MEVLQLGAVLGPLEVSILPAVPGLLFGIIAPENLILPVTSKDSVGFVFPMPTCEKAEITKNKKNVKMLVFIKNCFNKSITILKYMH